MKNEYYKAANKLLQGISDKRLLQPEIWDDIVKSIREGKFMLWEINNEILLLKYFCKEKIELASSFTETDQNGVRFDNLNDYFINAIKTKDKGYFNEFIAAYEPTLNGMANAFVVRYGLQPDDADDIKQIFLETLWLLFLEYNKADSIPLLQYAKKAVPPKQLEFIRTTKNACSVPTHNGYLELRKVMRIYNDNEDLTAAERMALIEERTGFSKEKITELLYIGKATEYPLAILSAEDDEVSGTVSEEVIEDPSVSLFQEAWLSICRDYFSKAVDNISPKEKQIIELSEGVCFNCYGIFKPNTYAEISLKQGAAGEKSIEKKRKAAIEKFSKQLCELGFCDGVTLRMTDIKRNKGKLISVTYSYTPFVGGAAGELIYIPANMKPFQIIKLAEYDITGAYSKQAAKFILDMDGSFIKERFYAIPLECLPRVNKANLKPKFPFYRPPNNKK